MLPLTRSAATLLVTLLCLGSILQTSEAAVIASIQPQSGSLNGGQLITITGSGFMRQGTDGTTVAYIGNNECVQIEYYSTDSQYVCTAPEAPGLLEGAYDVQIVIEGEGVQGFGQCLMNTGCTFTYSADRTSSVASFPSAAGAGVILPFHATAVDAHYFAFWNSKIGQTWCELDYAGNSDWQAVYGNGTAAEARGYLSDVYVEPFWTNDYQCFTHEQPAARTNFTINILAANAPEDAVYYPRPGGGLADMPHTSYQVDLATDLIHNFEALPLVNSFSSANGGSQGGAPLTISGTGFWDGCADTTVTLSGQPCSLRQCTANKIVCVPSAANTVADPTLAAYSGLRGLYSEVWYNVAWNSLANVFNNIATNNIAPDFTLTQAGGFVSTPQDRSQYYVERQSGLFTPPFTATYTFYLSGQHLGELYLSNSSDAAGLQKIASFNNPPAYYGQASQISQSFALTAGTSYAVQLRYLHGGWEEPRSKVLLKMDPTSVDPSTPLPTGYPSESVLKFHSLPKVLSVGIQTDVRREVQQLQFTGVAGGTFRVQYGLKLSDEILFSNVTANSFKNSLQKILSASNVCSDITVTLNNQPAQEQANFTVQFNCPGAVARATLNIVNDGLVASATTTLAYTSVRLQTPSLPASGTFTVGWSSDPNVVLYNPNANMNRNYALHIPFDASASDFKQALLTITGLRTLDVTASGNVYDGQTFTVTFYEPYGAIPDLQLLNDTLTGENVQFVSTLLQEGDSTNHYWHTLPGDFLTYAQQQNRVQVSVKGITAVCNAEAGSSYVLTAGAKSGDCTYDYIAANTPTITALNTPNPGAIAAGDILTITGTGFLPIASGNVVAFQLGSTGALADAFDQNVQCGPVSVVSAGTVLTCVVPDLAHGSYTVQVNVANAGLNAPNPGVPTLAYSLRIDSISPTSGSTAGGTLLNLAGSGFNSADVIQVGGVACPIVAVSVTAAVCRTAAGSAGTVAITVNGVAQSASFTYDAAFTPVISAVDPILVSSAVTNLITITGTGFVANNAYAPPAALNTGSTDDSSIFNDYAVNFGDRWCHIVTVSSTQVICRLARANPPDIHSTSNALQPTVYVVGQGYAANPSSLTVDIALRIHTLSINHGSLAGGSYITITGEGFKPKPQLITDTSVSIDPDYISVSIGNFTTCHVQSYNMTTVVCITNSTNVLPADLTSGSLVGKVNVSINNIKSVCGGATDSVCEFSFLVADTPVISSINPTAAVSGTTLTITGTDLGRSGPTVFIGHDTCAVTFQSNTSIECTIPAHTVASLPVYVSFDGTGFASSGVALPFFTYQLSITSIDVTSGSTGGGSLVTITGTGFSASRKANVLTVGGLKAYVVSASTTSLSFLTPPVPRSSVDPTNGLAANIVVVTKAYDVLVDYFSTDVVTANIPTGVYPVQFVVNTTSATPFTYSLSLTPTLSTVSPTSGAAGTVVSITGLSLGASQGASTVEVGGVTCSVTAWADTAITCTLGSSPAGAHAVEVTIAGQGLAATSTSTPLFFTALLSISSVAPLIGGYGGGTLITIQGTGFSSVKSEDLVQVCNSQCQVQTASYSQITCYTNPIVTLDRLRQFGPTVTFQAQGTAYGTGGASAASYASVFDGNVETGFTSTSGGCQIRLDTGNSTNLALTRIRFYPTYQQATLFAGSQFYASNDGTNWQLIATVATFQEGWNYIDIVDTNVAAPNVTQSFRYFGFASGQTCKVQELEFQGYRVAALPGLTTVSNPPVDVASCPVSVQVNTLPASHTAGDDIISATYVASSQFQYSLTNTPTITAINPTHASALGGDLVTITGTGFVASNVGAHTVMLNDYPCAVQSVDATGTSIVCLTGARTTARPAPSGREISVLVQGASGPGYAIAVATTGASILVNQALPPMFRYLDKWSDLTTWRFQEPPVAGDTVVIPQGQAVLLDVSPPELFFLLIQGVLVFDNKDLTLDASYIYVQGGQLQIGTETQPFANKATITLHGDRWTSIELPHYGSKCLVNGPISYAMRDGIGAVPVNPLANFGNGVDPTTLPAYYSDNWDGRGRLDLHGIPRIRTWTKVGTTALAGSSSVVTDEDVDFAAGEEVVITSTNTYEQTERRIVASLGADKRTVTFTEPLQYDHIAQWFSSPGQSSVDMRFEIGLLTRNIVIQGDENSVGQQYGGHIMSLKGGILRAENIEIRHMGQSFNLGRYSIHFHLADQVHESYIRSNSIHDAFQRACTVHGSHYARVQNNVAAFIKGHTYFVEDGNEKYNVIEGNLGVYTMRLTSMLRSDTKPATFWTSSPENFWRHNVAAGCVNDGYWLELPGNPGGPSFTTTICPVHGHLGEFFNNTAHSNGVHGLRIYPEYIPFVNPCDENSGMAAQTFTNFTSFHNGENGIFGKHNGQLIHTNHKLVENGAAELSWVKLEGVRYADQAHINNVLFVATTDPVHNPYWGSEPGLWTPQNEYFKVGSATFVNYGNTGAIYGCNDCGSDDLLKQGGYTIRTSGLQFINSNKRVGWTVPFKEIFMDLDGTLTGSTNSSVTYYRQFNNWPECTVDTVGTFDYGISCDSTVRIRRMQFDHVTPQEFDWLYITLTQGSGIGEISSLAAGATPGQASVQFLPKEIYGWVVPMVTTHYYGLTWLTRMDWRTLKVRYSEPAYVKYLSIPGKQETNEWIGYEFNYTDYRYNFAVVSSDNTLRPWKETAIDNTDDTGVGAMGNLLGKNGTWDLMVSSKNSSLWTAWDPLTLNIRALQCPLAGCPLPPPIKLGNITRWSDPLSWPLGVVPLAGQDVTITNVMNILYDIDVPMKYGKITIEGALTFEDVSDKDLTAASIVVFGDFFIGSATTPFTHKAKITLTGERNSPSVVVSNSQFLGNKVLAIFGQGQFYGSPRVFTQTTLTSTLAAGSNSLIVNDAVDWVVGDEIVVSPTEYDSSQAETFTITDVTGQTITLDRAATYSHFGGIIDTSSSISHAEGGGPPSTLLLAASVGLLTRNIQFTSDLSLDATYGGHVHVSEIVSETVGSADSFIGSLAAQYVDFRAMGQQSMEHPALGFFYSPDIAGTAFAAQPDLAINSVVGCAFSYGLNYAIKGEGSPNVLLDQNVIYQTYRSSIFWDDLSTGAIITNNLVVGTKRSPDDTHVWINPFASIFAFAPVAQLSGNTVGGSQDIGIAYYPEPCGQAPTVYNNNVHSTKVGVFLLSNGKVGCVQAHGFTSWKAAHIAIVTVDQTNNVELSNVVVSDSHIGISLNYFRAELDDYSLITNSRILGSTAASSDCTVPSTCLAANAADVVGAGCNSVYGSTVRRIGLTTSQYTKRGKTCFIDGLNGGGLPVCRPPNTPERLCSMPWEQRYGTPTDGANGILNVTSTTFGYFQASDCGLRSAAVSWNPTSRDFVPPMNFKQIGWKSVASAAKFDFVYRAGISDGSCATGCDGLNELRLTDEDGTALEQTLGITGVTNSPAHTLLSANPLLAKPGTACVEQTAWGAIQCLDTVYRSVVVENMDSDRGSRKVGPLFSTRLSQSENRTDFSIGPFDDECPMRFFFGQYITSVIPQSAYHMYFAGSNPAITRITYKSGDQSEAILISFFYTQPLVLVVMVDDVEITNDNTVAATLDSDAYKYQFNPQARQITITLRGSGDLTKRHIDIVQKPLVQVTLALQVSITEFYGPTLVNNLAKLLVIDPSRIKIVSVQPGSTIVQMQIADSQPTSNINTVLDGQVQRLTALEAQIQSLAVAGALNQTSIGYDLISITTIGPNINGTAANQQVYSAPVALTPSSSSSSFPTWLIGLIVAVAALLIIGVSAILVVRHKRSSVARQFLVPSDVATHHHVTTKSVEPMAVDKPSTTILVGVAPRKEFTNPESIQDEGVAPPVVTIHTGQSEEGVSSIPMLPLSKTVLRKADRPLDAVPETESRGSSSPSSEPGAADELPEGHYQVIASYNPKFADELELQIGDTVVVLDGSSEIWFIGYCTRTAKRGSFPRTVVTRDPRLLQQFKRSNVSSSSGNTTPDSKKHSQHSPLHNRMDSSDDILRVQNSGRGTGHLGGDDVIVAQYSRELPIFERDSSNPSPPNKNQRQGTDRNLIGIKDKNSKMLRQASRK